MPKNFNDFFNNIKSKFSKTSSEPKTSVEPKAADKSETSNDLPDTSPNKYYDNEYYGCIRQVFIWGKDRQNNPGFLVLYGLHESTLQPNNKYALNKDVTFTHYAIFNGKDGHFPSFEAVKTIDISSYNSPKKDIRMFYKKDLVKHYYWHATDKSKSVGFFYPLPGGGAVISYSNAVYQDYYNVVCRLNLDNFFPAKDPNEILNLKDELLQYYPLICKIYSDNNIYMRKKCLTGLISLNPLPELYDFLLNTGSCELISGLFLELARNKNNILLDKAEQLISSEPTWESQSYINGLKRCATLYCDLFNRKEDKIKALRKNLPDIDLQLVHIKGKDIPEDKIISGAAYRKYSISGYYRDYTFEYNREQRKSEKVYKTKRFKKNFYTDGLHLDIVKFKNTIQEAEIFELPDVIGKIAYYIDAPRLVYYFKGTQRGVTLRYFQRYLRRLINFYAVSDELKFMEAMKSLLLSYTYEDCLCKFKDFFQYNYFLKYYLFNSLDIAPPADYRQYYIWRSTNLLYDSKGRYEFMPEIWNRHFDYVVEIAEKAAILPVSKAMYYILTDLVNHENLSSISYANLVKLASSNYEKISKLFMETLSDRLKNESHYDSEIMFTLLEANNPSLATMASEYLKRTEGKLSFDDIGKFLLLGGEWTDLAEACIQGLTPDEYLNFIYNFIENTSSENILSDESKDILNNSLDKLNLLTEEHKTQLFLNLADIINNKTSTTKFVENLIFSFSIEEIKNILNFNEMQFKSQSTISYLLHAIKNETVPDNNILLNILENASSKMVKALTETLFLNRENLKDDFGAILILMESDSTPLNNLAKEIFDNLDINRRKDLHVLILDSPIQKAYSYAIEKLYEIYENSGEFVPPEFLVQMLEHSSAEVKNYISDKVDNLIQNFKNFDKELFMYYVKTLLFLPNKISKGKDNIYTALPEFVKAYPEKHDEIEEILINIGNSNIILDSERALVALAKIRMEAVLVEG